MCVSVGSGTQKRRLKGASCAPCKNARHCVWGAFDDKPVSHAQVEVQPELSGLHVEALPTRLVARLSLESALPDPVWQELQRRAIHDAGGRYASSGMEVLSGIRPLLLFFFAWKNCM